MTRTEALTAAHEMLKKAEAAVSLTAQSVEWAEVYATRARTYARISQGYIDLARELDKPKPVR